MKNERDIWWFQPRAIQSVLSDWRHGARAVCLVSPPGSGKTEMAATIAKTFRRPVCFGHTLGLVRNGLRRLCETYTVQSILSQGGIPGKTPPDLVIWDECHHSEGEVWGSALDYVPKKAKVLGLTATPQRSDGKALNRFDTMVVAAHYSELLLAGTIVPFRCLHPKQFLEDAEPDPFLAYQRYGERKKAIFYCTSVEQADDVARRLGKKASAWHGEMNWNTRRDALDAFEANKLRCLVTVDAFTEGVDVPDSDCIVLASKCHNVMPYLQKTGRGGRAAPGKEECLLLDLSGAHLRHGPPTEDREYSITGTGIRRKNSRGGNGWYYERGEREKKELDRYDAELVTGYNWRAPTSDDKARQLRWLTEIAGRRGWGREIAEQAFKTMYGEEPGS